MNLVEKMRISPDRQITIPKSIHEKAGLLPGCDVEFHVENGRVWLAAQQLDRAKRRASSLSDFPAAVQGACWYTCRYHRATDPEGLYP